MKLTRIKLRSLVKEELNRLVEMQTGLGLLHNFSNDELYKHTFDFITQTGSIQRGTPEYEKAEGLLIILSNRVVQAVSHDQGGYDEETDEYRAGTTPEETAYMREIQGKLKMIKMALMQAMNHVGIPDAQTQSWRQSKRDDYKAQSDEFDAKGVSKYSSERPDYIRKRRKR
jgi:hypothetical protein